jgi:putative sterol carrier protein
LKRALALAALGALVPAGAAAQGEVPLMSAPWAKAACQAWNAEPALTEKLAESGWADNNADRGFKVLQIYRSDCADSPRVELRIAAEDGKARCNYGGAAETAKLDTSADYLMYAETARWQEMGRGEYGPMRAMMFNRLQFDGPMLEAMRNMGPFESFLLLVGKVPGAAACPAR